MKNKILIILLIIFLFILFAIPIPISIFGFFFSFIWVLGSLMEGLSFLETTTVLCGLIIIATYILTYIFALIKTCEETKISIKTFLPIAHCLLFMLFLLYLKPINNHIENPVIGSLPKFESSDCYYSDGFQDFTNYCKYYFSEDDFIIERIKENKYLKKVTVDDVEEVKSYFENFKGWVEFQEYKEKYDFRDNCIDTEDYFYIENDETIEEHKYWDYDVYFFDVQTKTLYFIHSNI